MVFAIGDAANGGHALKRRLRRLQAMFADATLPVKLETSQSGRVRKR
jgi:hypothetical protein